MKKSTIFEKLKHRWRSGNRTREAGGKHRAAGRNIDAAMGGGVADDIGVARARASAKEERLPVPPRQRAGGRKLSAREDAVMALGEGFSELASLMRGVQVRMEDQGGEVSAMAKGIGQLPELGRAQIEALERLGRQVEQQGEVGEKLLATFGELPDLMKSVQGALNRAAATDERTAQSLSEFRSNMDRVQSQMSKLVEHGSSQAHATAQLVRDQREGADRLVADFQSERKRDVTAMRGVVEELGKEQADTFERLGHAHQNSLERLRKAQEDQANRLGKVMADHGKWNRAMLVMMIMSFAALACIFIVLLAQ